MNVRNEDRAMARTTVRLEAAPDPYRSQLAKLERALLRALITVAVAGTIVAWTASVSSGQALASTLTNLVDRADTIVRARALGYTNSAERPGETSVTFLVQERLRSSRTFSSTRTITLHEPEGDTCGHALQRLAIGAGYIVFARERDGELAAAASTARSLVAVTPIRLGHVRALTRAGAATRARVTILSAALSLDDERVRTDAALALSVLPGLEQFRAEPDIGTAVVGALARQLPTNAQAGAALLCAAERLGAAGAREPILAALLASEARGPRPRRAPVRGLANRLASSLNRLDPDGSWLVDQVTRRRDTTQPAAARRIGALLARHAGRADARRAMVSLAETVRGPSVGRVRARVAATLLSHGEAADEVERELGVDALDEARRGALSLSPSDSPSERPTFRVIRPHKGR